MAICALGPVRLDTGYNLLLRGNEPFGETAGGDSRIETMPRRGYRFVGPVTTAEGAARAGPRRWRRWMGKVGKVHTVICPPAAALISCEPHR